MDRIGTPKWFQDRGVATTLQKRSLLVAVNLVAGLSIFFFGYDQGVMAGVNQTQSYVEIMGFGHWTGTQVQVDKPLKQGSIVRIIMFKQHRCYEANSRIERYIL